MLKLEAGHYMEELKNSVRFMYTVLMHDTPLGSVSALSPFLIGRMLTLFAEHTSDTSTNYDSFLN